MLNPLYTYILNIYDLVWLGFMTYQTIVGYLMLNPLYTYILNIYDLVWLAFMAYQPLSVISSKILFIHKHFTYICFVNSFCLWHFKMSLSSFFTYSYNDLKHFYLTWIILFYYYCIQWRDYTICYLTIIILLNTIDLFSHS